MNIVLYISAFLIVAAGFAHSYLGERHILMPLFQNVDLSKAFRRPQFVMRTLRFAWHITSLAWFGLAAVVIALAHPPASAQAIGLIAGCTFLVHFLVSVLGSRGKHLSWPVFLAAGVLVIYASI